MGATLSEDVGKMGLNRVIIINDTKLVSISFFSLYSSYKPGAGAEPAPGKFIANQSWLMPV